MKFLGTYRADGPTNRAQYKLVNYLQEERQGQVEDWEDEESESKLVRRTVPTPPDGHQVKEGGEEGGRMCSQDQRHQPQN